MGCAMAAMAGASGARSWLAARHLTWLTPRRLRLATGALFVAATVASSLVLSGSSAVRAGARPTERGQTGAGPHWPSPGATDPLPSRF